MSAVLVTFPGLKRGSPGIGVQERRRQRDMEESDVRGGVLATGGARGVGKNGAVEYRKWRNLSVGLNARLLFLLMFLFASHLPPTALVGYITEDV